MDNRTFITVDGYKFEVNTIGKYTEKQFQQAFEKLPNFHWRNAFKQIKKEHAKLEA